ncbi:SHOCT domain-containing protein [Streptomyces malaysiensis]|uniref:SHOCT domain-containing protein n=1 Tax=Streptomyces malaysiensis subsp. samsunensis TaxID=459658 RepID=A0A9X2M1D8_STRMQ|nr:SHOCT domain-containing protein [Streptomyces samsunensis]MCQ8833527.1 SHOCT domain-containing protein [Streptomyces samsunensis]WPB94848.1 SHOCT domain-containing protein [Streptomyces malaysiensis]
MNYPLLNIFLTTMWVFLWVLWLFLLFRVLADLFRDDSLSGWAKAGWTVFVLVLPFLGVFVYLVARGREMGVREMKRAEKAEADFREVMRTTATTGQAEELAHLVELKNHGDLTPEEYERAKAKVLAA